MIRANLIPQSRRDRAARRRHARRCVVLTAGYVAIVAVSLAGYHVALGPGGREDLSDEIAAAESQLVRNQAQQDKAMVELEAVRNRILANNVVAKAPRWSVLMGQLSGSASEELVLRRMLLVPLSAPAEGERAAGLQASTWQETIAQFEPATGFALRLWGVGRSHEAVLAFVLSLERSALFDEVALVGTRPERFMDRDATAFEVRCSLTGGEELFR